MDKKTYYVEIAWVGSRNYKQIPINCTEDEINVVATAIGKGADADSCCVFLTNGDNSHVQPYIRLWDCM